VIAASGTELKLKTDAGQEAIFGVWDKVGEQVKALKKGDRSEVSYATYPRECCHNPIVTLVKKLYLR
jgi:D-arabinose 1-dehydrogenase-like Zn-dependent alcohol dehydrogenase